MGECRGDPLCWGFGGIPQHPIPPKLGDSRGLKKDAGDLLLSLSLDQTSKSD